MGSLEIASRTAAFHRTYQWFRCNVGVCAGLYYNTALDVVLPAGRAPFQVDYSPLWANLQRRTFERCKIVVIFAQNVYGQLQRELTTFRMFEYI